MPLHRARAAELRGELSLAAALFAEAGRPDEVARVIVLRGDSEGEPAMRLRHYAHAVTTAPLGSAVHALARRKHATTVVVMARAAPLTAASRYDLTRAAGELEGMEDFAGAAEAYAQAGDLEAQARVLTRAGDVDGLEALLAEEQQRERAVVATRRSLAEFMLLVASGQRRDAVDLARTSADHGLRGLGADVARRRLAGSLVHATLVGQRVVIALGDEVVVGRAPEEEAAEGSRTGHISIASPVVSRKHLAIVRRGDGVFIRDLASRHGTFHRRRPLRGEARVGEGIELLLGGDVNVVVRPTGVVDGAVAIETGGASFIAPLGPARLGVGRWRLQRGDDGWVELTTEDDPPAFAGSLQLARCVTLLVGDAIASGRGGATALEILAHGA
jgi:hypothetical protein